MQDKPRPPPRFSFFFFGLYPRTSANSSGKGLITGEPASLVTMGRFVLTLPLVCNAASLWATTKRSPGICQKHNLYLIIRPIKQTTDGKGGVIFRCFPRGLVVSPWKKSRLIHDTTILPLLQSVRIGLKASRPSYRLSFVLLRLTRVATLQQTKSPTSWSHGHSRVSSAEHTLPST